MRKLQIVNGKVADFIDNFKSDCDELRSELDDWLSNLPENLQSSNKADMLQSCIDILDTANNVEDAPEAVANLECGTNLIQPRSKRQGLSRADRLNNAISYLDAAIGVVQEALDEQEEGNADWEAWVGSAEDTKNEVESAEFPGMYS